ncbi:MAG TPA: hypothetical protein VF092_18765 [Longimicrobium sp.]
MENLTGMIAVLGGLLLVLIPIAGLTARFALKPLIESIAAAMRARQGPGGGESLASVERRLASLEAEVSSLRTDLVRLGDGRDFDRKLAASSTEPGQGES